MVCDSIPPLNDNRALPAALFPLFPDRVVGSDRLEIGDHALIKGMYGDGGAVADDDQLASGARQSHIHAVYIFQKADLTLTVGTHQRNDHGFFFAPLETVHTVDFHLGLL